MVCVPLFPMSLGRGNILLTILCQILLILNCFNAENRGKTCLPALKTTTPEGNRQNTNIPDSKASFAAYRVINHLQECQTQTCE